MGQSMSGWIKVDRKIMQNALWTDDEPFDKRSAWIDLLLMANHSDHEIFHRGKIVIVKRGEVNRSVLQLSQRWHWSRNKTMRFLGSLKRASMITTKSTTDGTTISIENYNKYQFTQTTNDTTKGTTDDTTHDTTDGTHTINIKEYIKNNQERERKIMTNADKVGMSVKDFIKAKARGEI